LVDINPVEIDHVVIQCPTVRSRYFRLGGNMTSGFFILDSIGLFPVQKLAAGKVLVKTVYVVKLLIPVWE